MPQGSRRSGTWVHGDSAAVVHDGVESTTYPAKPSTTSIAETVFGLETRRAAEAYLPTEPTESLSDTLSLLLN